MKNNLIIDIQRVLKNKNLWETLDNSNTSVSLKPFLLNLKKRKIDIYPNNISNLSLDHFNIIYEKPILNIDLFTFKIVNNQIVFNQDNHLNRFLEKKYIYSISSQKSEKAFKELQQIKQFKIDFNHEKKMTNKMNQDVIFRGNNLTQMNYYYHQLQFYEKKYLADRYKKICNQYEYFSKAVFKDLNFLELINFLSSEINHHNIGFFNRLLKKHKNERLYNFFKKLMINSHDWNERNEKLLGLKNLILKWGRGFIGFLENNNVKNYNINELNAIYLNYLEEAKEIIIEPLKLNLPFVEEICSAYELIQEGNFEDHCIGGYGMSLKRQNSRFFKIITNKEKTIAQINTYNNRIVQHYGRSNKKPSREHKDLEKILIEKIKLVS